MKTLLNRWFIACCIIWLIITITRRLGHPVPLINGYINDVAAIPVIANLGLWFQRVYIVKTDYYILGLKHIVLIVMYVTIVFEIILPRISKIYTADWIDALLYIVGGLFFYLVMNKPVVEQRNPESRVKMIN